VRGGAPDAGGEGFDMSAPLTPSEKRTITRRANKAKREAIAAAILAEQDARATASADPNFEAKILELIAIMWTARTDAYAAATSTQGHRRELAREPVVSLAAWRASVLPPSA
jgi:hypothetical protein